MPRRGQKSAEGDLVQRQRLIADVQQAPWRKGRRQVREPTHGLFEEGCQVHLRRQHRRQPFPMMRAADVERMGQGPPVQVRMFAAEVGEPLQIGLQLLPGPGRETHRQARDGGRHLLRIVRRRLENAERIGPADPQAIDRGQTGFCRPLPKGCRPRRGAGHDPERRALEIDIRIGLVVVERRHQGVMPEHQGDLDQAGQAGRLFEMADIGLHATDGTKTLVIGIEPKGLLQRLDLQRVADLRRRAMTLDVADPPRIGIGASHGPDHRLGLPRDAGGGVADFHRPVVVDLGRLDHGVDMIAVAQRIGQAPHHHRRHPTAEHRAAGLGGKRRTASVQGQQRALATHITDMMRNTNGAGAHQADIDFPQAQGIAGQVQRHQRAGTGGLHGHARPCQVELERQAGREEILVIAQVHQAGGFLVLGIEPGAKMLQVAGGDPTATGEDPGHGPLRRTYMASILERRITDFEQ